MGFLSWLTGRDEKESDVYANYDKVDSVVQEINSIGTNQVETARTEINAAITELNNVNGVAQYVGQVNAGGYDSVFESIASSISQIGEQLQNKADSIKEYEESAWYEKLGSTFAMTGAKLGEGILSVAEDIGDGVVSIAGWIAPKDSGVEKACESFVKKNWSHDAFNFYYNSDFAKKSTFTEDSAIAGGLKIVGSTAGYLALGGIVSGAAVPLANSSKGVIKAAGTFLNSTTKVNTLTAALSGMGSGTEAGLQSGLSMNEAAAGGAKQAAIQGTLAYAGGKLGEKATKKQVAKDFEGTGKDSTKFMSKDNAKKEIQASTKITESGKQKLMDEIDNMSGKVVTRRRVANEVLKSKDLKLNNFQGYTDSITQNAYKNVTENGLVRGTGKTLLNGVSAVTVKPVKAVGKTVQNGYQSVKTQGLQKSLTGGMNNIKQGITKGVSNIKNIPKNVPNIVEKSAGVVAIGTNAAISTTIKGDAAAQFKKTSAARTIVGTPDDGTIQITADEPEKIEKTPSVGGNNDNTGGNTGGGNTGGGNTGGGNTGGGSTGGGSTGGNYEDSSVQFRSNVDKDADKKATNDDKKSEKPSNTTTNANKSEKPSNTTTDANKSEKPSNTTTDANKSEKPSNTTTNTVTTPSSTNTGTTTTTTGGSTTGSGTFHTGGGYTGTGGYTENNTTLPTDATTETTTSGLDDIKDTLTDGTTSIEDVIKGSKYTKIPSTPSPVTTSPSSGGASAVIPIAAGLSAAAAAGIGAKAYMDRKKNNDNGEDEDEFDTDEWSGDDSVDIQYDDSSDNENYLDADDDYSYQTEDSSEKYDARSSDELADLQ